MNLRRFVEVDDDALKASPALNGHGRSDAGFDDGVGRGRVAWLVLHKQDI